MHRFLSQQKNKCIILKWKCIIIIQFLWLWELLLIMINKCLEQVSTDKSRKQMSKWIFKCKQHVFVPRKSSLKNTQKLTFMLIKKLSKMWLLHINHHIAYKLHLYLFFGSSCDVGNSPRCFLFNMWQPYTCEQRYYITCTFCMLAFWCISSNTKWFKTPLSIIIFTCFSLLVTILPMVRSADSYIYKNSTQNVVKYAYNVTYLKTDIIYGYKGYKTRYDATIDYKLWWKTLT